MDPGFRPERLLTVQISLPAAYSADGRKIAIQHQMLDRVRTLPGVASAGFTSFLPFTDQNSRLGFVIDGIPPDPGEPPRQLAARHSGLHRDQCAFRWRAAVSSRKRIGKALPSPCWSTKTAARRYWPGRDPIGSRARLATMEPCATVVGVVGEVKHWGLEEGARPEAYLSSYQAPLWMMNLVVRTHTDPESLAATVRGELRTIDKSIPALETRTMEDLIAATTSSRRFLTWLVTGFALLALLLAAGGTFAQVAYTVSQRSHEIGIRVALGASRASVVGLMMGQTLALIVCGGLLGIAATSGVARIPPTGAVLRSAAGRPHARCRSPRDAGHRRAGVRPALLARRPNRPGHRPSRRVTPRQIPICLDYISKWITFENISK